MGETTQRETPGVRAKSVWRVRLFAVVLSLGVSALLLEVGLRLVLPQPLRWLNVYATAEGLPYRLRSGAVQENVGDGWTVFVNGEGYRARSTDDVVVSGQPFLLAVGDSFAFGHGVEYEDGFVAQLEARFPAMRILNAAVPGFGAVEYRTVIERHLDRPGLSGVLVFTFLGNDFQDCRESEPRRIHNGALGAGGRSFRYWAKANSHLYRFFSENSVSSGDTELSSEPRIFVPEAWNRPPLAGVRKIYAEAFRDIAALCRERDVPLFVVLLPAYYDEAGKTNPHDIHGPIRIEVFDRLLARGFQYGDKKQPALQASKIFEELGIRFADVTPELNHMDGSPYIPRNGHYTPETNARVAEWLGETIPEFFVP